MGAVIAYQDQAGNHHLSVVRNDVSHSTINVLKRNYGTAEKAIKLVDGGNVYSLESSDSWEGGPYISRKEDNAWRMAERDTGVWIYHTFKFTVEHGWYEEFDDLPDTRIIMNKFIRGQVFVDPKIKDLIQYNISKGGFLLPHFKKYVDSALESFVKEHGPKMSGLLDFLTEWGLGNNPYFTNKAKNISQEESGIKNMIKRNMSVESKVSKIKAFLSNF